MACVPQQDGFPQAPGSRRKIALVNLPPCTFQCAEHDRDEVMPLERRRPIVIRIFQHRRRADHLQQSVAEPATSRYLGQHFLFHLMKQLPRQNALRAMTLDNARYDFLSGRLRVKQDVVVRHRVFPRCFSENCGSPSAVRQGDATRRRAVVRQGASRRLRAATRHTQRAAMLRAPRAVAARAPTARR